MSENAKFGKLEKLKIRHYWPNEASDFTPWLAEKESIALLGEAIGLELEVEQQEKSVGSFKLDILCKDIESDRAVIVENQYDKTDHGHLGQLMTYAAGLDAKSVVWIAEKFTDEHRAALDWLNEKTGEEIHFFGVQIEVWRIGDSAAAPRFEVVAKPNDWTKLIRTSKKSMTETEKQQLEFWTEFREFMIKQGGTVRATKPSTGHWMSFSIGRAGFHLSTAVLFMDDAIRVQLVIDGPEKNACFHLLFEQKENIEKSICPDAELKWREMPGKKQSQVRLQRSNCNANEKSNWADLHGWLYQYLEAFHAAFSQRIKELNPTDWEPSEEYSDED